MSDFPLEDRARPGGAVVVTLFACRSRWDVLLIWWLHHRIKPAVQARTRGFLGVRLYIDWRRRVVRSVSLWTDAKYLYDMGEVSEHVDAARIPRRLGARTTCGIYTYEGEWTELMFGLEPSQKPNPLTDPYPGPAERSGPPA